MCTPSVLAALALPMSGVANTDAGSLLAAEFDGLRGVLTMEAGGAAGTFTAGAVNDPGLTSFGTVWRGVPPAGEALFDTGFVAEPNPADVSVNLALGEIRDKRAGVAGTAVFTDVDGDTVVLLLTGFMTFGPGGQVVADTTINSVEVVSDEGMFDGTDGGSVSTIDFESARGTLRIDFAYWPTQAGNGRGFTGAVFLQGSANGPRGVPAPSAAGAVVATGALLAIRRRRPCTIGRTP